MRTTTSSSSALSLLLLASAQTFFSSPTFANAAPADDGKGACHATRGPANGKTPRPEPPAKVDVAVVGGGFSGMASAYQLHQAGLKVVVLEATEILGGRSRSQPLKTGPGLVELGATWINNVTQPAVFALTEEFGLELIEQHTDGHGRRELLDGTVINEPEEEEEGEDGSTPVDEDFAELEALQEDFLTALTITENTIDIEVFDEFPVEEDVSFADWVARNESWDNPYIYAVSSQLTSGIVGREPTDIGAHYWFDYLKSGGGWRALLDDGERGAQRHMIKTGTTSIVTSIRDAMPKDSVLTRTPVTSIKQEKDIVLLTAAKGQRFEAKRAIIAIMPSTYSKIEFSPALPEDKQGLVSASQEGIYAKVLVTYAAPWWREANLTGQFFSFTGPITYSLETSVPELEQYSLACFVAGDFAVDWFELPDDEKEAAIVEHLATMAPEGFADYARDTLEINYVEWTNEEYIGGGPTNAMGPGMLRKYGKTLREPVDGLHFAGTETAYEWKGYLEGAVTAGQRTAAEVLGALGVATD